MVASVSTSGYTGAEVACAIQPRLFHAGTGVKGIIATHGHGGNWAGWAQNVGGWNNTPSAGWHSVAQAKAGRVWLSIDAGGPNSWGCAGSQTAMDAAYTYLLGAVGCAGPKVALAGYSMGALVVLNWLRNNPGKVACAFLFAPAVDLQFFYGQGGSYQAEITAALAGAGVADYNPQAHAAAYTGLDVPVMMAVGDQDTTVPPAQTAAFMAAVNNPGWTRTVVPGKNHLSIFDGVPPEDVSAFFTAHL